MTGTYTPIHTISATPPLAWTSVNVNLEIIGTCVIEGRQARMEMLPRSSFIGMEQDHGNQLREFWFMAKSGQHVSESCGREH